MEGAERSKDAACWQVVSLRHGGGPCGQTKALAAKLDPRLALVADNAI
jgi:hypothetical protein